MQSKSSETKLEQRMGDFLQGSYKDMRKYLVYITNIKNRVTLTKTGECRTLSNTSYNYTSIDFFRNDTNCEICKEALHSATYEVKNTKRIFEKK